MLRRLLLPPTAVLVLAGLVACGSGDAGSAETLPPIRTTSTVSTTTTVPDTRRRFYEVKPGDTLADIAARAEVPPGEIVKLNNLPDNGNLLQVGQIIEIPTDMVLVDLTTTTASESTEP